MVDAVAGRCPADPVHREGSPGDTIDGMCEISYAAGAGRGDEEVRRVCADMPSRPQLPSAWWASGSHLP